MEVKSEMKSDLNKKTIKAKKIRKPLNLSSDEESTDTSEDIYSKKHEEFKSRLFSSRLQTLQSCRTKDDELTEDVFSDKTSKSKPNIKEDLVEVISLMADIRSQESNNKEEDIDITEEDNNITEEDNNDSITEVINEVIAGSVASNTRSRTRPGQKKKAVLKKMVKKKTTRRKSGKNRNETEFDEQTAFDRLEGLQAMDDIEVVEEFDSSLNVSQEVEEYIKERDIEIKVKYKAVIEKFLFKSSEKFCKIMPIIAQKFNENVSELIFDLNEQMIDSDSTPQSIGLTISDIIVCHKRVTNKSVNNQCKDPNEMSLKLKDKTMKSGQTFTVNKFDKIEKIVDLFSKFKGLPPKKFRLEFDGEKLDSDSTIAECDIEDESQIDVILL